MSGLLGIGIRSLMAYQSAIQVASQNLQNARTPFYSRKQINFVESMFNSGVQISDVNRVYDDLANKNLLKSSSAMNSANKFFESMSDLEKMLDSDTTGINKYLTDALQSLQELTKDVSSPQVRASYLSKLSSITARFRQMGAEVSQKRTDLNENIRSTVTSMNDITSQIAALNSKIASVSGDERSTLLDQRNALTHELSQYIDFTTYTDNTDDLKIMLSNGLELVSGGMNHPISVETDPSDSSNLKLFASIGNNKSEITTFFKGGSLYGMMRVKSEALDSVERGLGRMTYAMAALFNSQNKLGVDYDGNLGKNIFNDYNSLALSQGRVTASSINSGSGVLSVNIDDPSKLILSDYQLVFSDATHYSMKRLSDNTVVSDGTISGFPTSITFDGMTTTIASGAFSAGDSFMIKPMKNALQTFNMALTDPNKLALGYPVSVSAQQSNEGQGQISVDAITDTNNSAFSIAKQLNPPIKVVFLTDTSYQIVNANTNAVIEGPLTYDVGNNNAIFPSTGGYDPGYRVSIKGTIKAGDTFNINYNTNVSGDNRNALKMVNMYTDKYLDNGRMNLSEAYHFTSGDISSKTNIAKSELESSLVMFNQSEMRYNQISGVSNIEEMSSLAEYQESYQACAQVVQVAKSVFDTIINMIR